MPGWEPDAPLKDYIAGMKDNGYQSLHLYIRNMAVGTHVETQVRTLAMHKTAEMGEPLIGTTRIRSTGQRWRARLATRKPGGLSRS